ERTLMHACPPNGGHKGQTEPILSFAQRIPTAAPPLEKQSAHPVRSPEPSVRPHLPHLQAPATPVGRRHGERRPAQASSTTRSNNSSRGRSGSGPLRTPVSRA